MAKFVGGSSYLQDKKLEYKNWGWIYLLTLAIGTAVMWVDMSIVHFASVPTLFSIAVLLSLFLVIKKYFGISLPMAYRYKHGEHGEAVVEEILGELPDTYRIIKDVHVPNTGNNVDFVVIGPTGIFVLEVKNVRGEVTADGEKILENGRLLQNHDVLEQVRKEYWGVHDILQAKIGSEIFVIPVLVFAGLKIDVKLPEKIKDINIVHCSDIAEFTTLYKGSNIHNNEIIVKALTE